jgi:hypothetical protein
MASEKAEKTELRGILPKYRHCFRQSENKDLQAQLIIYLKRIKKVYMPSDLHC